MDPHPPWLVRAPLDEAGRSRLGRLWLQRRNAFHELFDAAPSEVDAWLDSSARIRSALHDACWGGACPAGWLALAADVFAAPPPLKSAAPISIQIPDALATLRPLWARDSRLEPLVGLTERLALTLPASIVPILFGSLGREEVWPQYADVDLLLVVRPHATADDLRLATIVFRSMLPRLSRIDPTHHHGPFVLLPADQAVYPEALLPVGTLGRATSLRPGPLSFQATPVLDAGRALESLLGVISGALQFARSPRSCSDRYSAKYLSSLVLLTPALWCAANGRAIDKADSFAFIYQSLSAPARATLEGFEALRRDWRHTLFPPAVLLRLAGAGAPRLARHWNRFPAPELARRLAPLASGLGPLFLELIDTLAERSWPAP